MVSAVLSTPMSMRIGSGVNTIASTFSTRISRPSEAMKRLVRIRAAALELLVERADRSAARRAPRPRSRPRTATASGRCKPASGRRRRSRRRARTPRRAPRGSGAWCRRSAPSRSRTARRGCPTTRPVARSWSDEIHGESAVPGYCAALMIFSTSTLPSLSTPTSMSMTAAWLGWKTSLPERVSKALMRLDRVLDALAVDAARLLHRRLRGHREDAGARCSTARRRSRRRSCSAP